MTAKKTTTQREAAGSCTDPMESIVLPVESPLEATYDPAVGVLKVESTIQRSADDRSFVRLELNFSPEAAFGFARVLKALEEQCGFELEPRNTTVQ